MVTAITGACPSDLREGVCVRVSMGVCACVHVRSYDFSTLFQSYCNLILVPFFASLLSLLYTITRREGGGEGGEGGG